MPFGKCFNCSAPLASATVVAVASKAAHRVQAVVAEAASGGTDPIRTDILALVIFRAGLVAVDSRAEVALRGLVHGAGAEGVRRVAAAEPSYGPRCRAHVHRHRGRCHNIGCAYHPPRAAVLSFGCRQLERHL